MTNVFIGKIIEQKIRERNMSISEFANRINRSRTTVYDIFQRKSIDIDLLLTISKALEFDFLSEIYVKKQGGSSDKKYYVAIEVDPSELAGNLEMVFNKKLDGMQVLQRLGVKSVVTGEQKDSS
ncbi:MAG: helix-turn-helix transcriptional regulator [Bacteroidales bacterium]|jgi:transcriptional regulator with XRE-family HTH domain|nr:helix-turn-helix transcriptional regulator [Bacteroidales bacterium]